MKVRFAFGRGMNTLFDCVTIDLDMYILTLRLFDMLLSS